MGEVGCWQRSVSTLSHTWARPELVEREIEARIGECERAAPESKFSARLEAEIMARRDRWMKRWGFVFLDHDLLEFVARATSGHQDAGFSLLFWMPVVLPYFAVRRWCGFGTTAKLRRALRNGVCPDCGYLLVTGPVVGGVRIGPCVCSECGGKWPLVPPPNAGEPSP